jgi:hypothetical protein
VPALADIFNAALANVGELSTTVSDPDTDSSAAARACRRYYDMARDSLLAAADWGFAHTLVRPTALTLASRPPDWAFAFAYPPDCLVIRGLFPSVTATTAFPALLADLPKDDGLSFVRVVLANASQPWLVYTRRASEPSAFPPLFTKALIWELAASLAMALARSETIRKTAEENAARWLSEAIAADNSEAPIPAFPESPMIAGRFGSGVPLLPGDDPSRWLGWRIDDIRRV